MGMLEQADFVHPVASAGGDEMNSVQRPNASEMASQNSDDKNEDGTCCCIACNTQNRRWQRAEREGIARNAG